MQNRQYSPFDKLIQQFDAGLRTVLGNPPLTERPNPANRKAEIELPERSEERRVGKECRL